MTLVSLFTSSTHWMHSRENIPTGKVLELRLSWSIRNHFGVGRGERHVSTWFIHLNMDVQFSSTDLPTSVSGLGLRRGAGPVQGTSGENQEVNTALRERVTTVMTTTDSRWRRMKCAVTFTASLQCAEYSIILPDSVDTHSIHVNT